jgi:hypothetical protein
MCKVIKLTPLLFHKFIQIINNLGGIIESNLSWIPPNPLTTKKIKFLLLLTFGIDAELILLFEHTDTFQWHYLKKCLANCRTLIEDHRNHIRLEIIES